MDKIKVIWTFIVEHWPLAFVLAGLIYLFQFVGRFAELHYGAIRLCAVVIVAFAVVNMVFKSTLRPYINSGMLVQDFERLDPKTRLIVALSVIFATLLLTTLCLALA